LRPGICPQGHVTRPFFRSCIPFIERIYRLSEQDAPRTQIPGQQHIRFAIADHKRLFQIKFTVQVFRQHSRSGFPGWQIICWETPVDVDIPELDSFIFEDLHQKILRTPEGMFWKRSSAQAILIGHHDQLVGLQRYDIPQCGDTTGDEFKFFERIHLVILRGFFEQYPIPIYKQGFFHYFVRILSCFINRSFSVSVPMVTRRQSRHRGLLCLFRITIPLSRRALNISWELRILNKRKLASVMNTSSTDSRNSRKCSNRSRSWRILLNSFLTDSVLLTRSVKNFWVYSLMLYGGFTAFISRMIHG